MENLSLNGKNKSIFKTTKGTAVNNVYNFIETWLKQHRSGQIFIGSDSQVRGNIVKYSTVICLWDVGHGVWEVYKTDVENKPKDRYTRLWNEVMRSVELADTLRGLGQINVHMDLNSNPKYPSYKLYDAGIGYVTSMGFTAFGKPYAWAATSGANRHCQ